MPQQTTLYTTSNFFTPRVATQLSGHFLIALPMLIYPFTHFLYMHFVELIVPPWIPWHAFWTVFTAITIFAAGISIIANRYTKLAATLLGIEILLFCILIHLFLLLRLHGDTWANAAMFGDYPSRLMNAPKDFGLSGACFILAGSLPGKTERTGPNWLLIFGQIIFSISIVAIALLHFFYPNFAPGMEPMYSSITFPLPGSRILAYLTGVEFLVLIAAITAKRHAWLAAVTLGLTILFFDLITWVPQFIHSPTQLYGNWLKDIGIAGGAFILASTLYRTPEKNPTSRF